MTDSSFKDFVLDQLSNLRGLRAKRMFGGYGLYRDDLFFGILMDGRLYFKTDETTKGDYEKRGMGPFVYEKGRKTVVMRYYEVPAEMIEDREELVRWARRAVEVAVKSK